MRRFLPFLIIAGLGILYLWQKSQQPPLAPKTPIMTATQTPAPRQVYEHDWAKHSIDKARDVAQKARAQTKDSQDP
jgi:hypothetical protein